MPLIKGAIKKLRQDRAVTERNRSARAGLRTTLKTETENLSQESLSKIFSALDKAVKRGLIKKGKADRTKSRLSKKITVSTPKKSPAKKVRKATKKRASSK